MVHYYRVRQESWPGVPLGVKSVGFDTPRGLDMPAVNAYRRAIEPVPFYGIEPNMRLMMLPPLQPAAERATTRQVTSPDKLAEVVPGEFPIVSGRAREVIERHDPVRHDFMPVDLIEDYDGSPLKVEGGWFLMNMRRVVDVREIEDDRVTPYRGYQPTKNERVAELLLHDRPALAERLGDLPLWRFMLDGQAYAIDNACLYLSSALRDALIAAGCHGLGLDGEPGDLDACHALTFGRAS